MANRVLAPGVVLLCVLVVGLAAAGLPAVSPEAVDDGGEVESQNRSLGGDGSSSGGDNTTYEMRGSNENASGNQSVFGGLIPRASGRLAGALSPSEERDGETSSESGISALLTGSEAVLVFSLLAVVGAALTLRSVSGSVDETAGDGEADEVPGEERREAAAAAASRAADAVADADGDRSDLSNAVYRAWYDLTAAVDVTNPDSATTGEFADAARSAGLDAGSVADLTAVFEAVRYGDEPATDHEERALTALRRIEADVDTDTGGESKAIDPTAAGDESGGRPSGEVEDR